MRKKENYERKRKHKKRWKQKWMEKIVACSFRIKIHIFLHFKKKKTSRISRQNLCQHANSVNIEEKMKKQSNYADIEEQPLLWTSRWKQILFLHLEFFRKLSQCFTSHFVVNRPKAKWKVALVLCNSFICQHNSYKKSELRSYLQMYSKHIGELGELENKKMRWYLVKAQTCFVAFSCIFPEWSGMF